MRFELMFADITQRSYQLDEQHIKITFGGPRWILTNNKKYKTIPD